MRKSIEGVLADELGEPPVDFEVEDGVATLRGSVERRELADMLAARLSDVPGVRGVAPYLSVEDEPERH